MMSFQNRHIGINKAHQKQMLDQLNTGSLDELCRQTIPDGISYDINPFDAMSEQDFENHINELAQLNTQSNCFIGQGFYRSYCPSIIRRNIFENPSWYTQYTPYQPEISQGRLEALLNFQTLITEMTGLPIANASLLDEGNACAEAIFMAYQITKRKKQTVIISDDVFSNSVHVIKTRFKYMDITIEQQPFDNMTIHDDVFAILGQTPSREGKVNDYTALFSDAKNKEIITICSTDLLALTLFKNPTDMNADIAIGSAQRLGIPLGFGGPSAAFIACKDEFKRLVPGRIIGISKDKYGKQAYRMALQTREQHIRREKATSNICTAQALLAIMNSFYAIYHGQDGLNAIATTLKQKATLLFNAFLSNGYTIKHSLFFDTITIEANNIDQLTEKALSNNIEWHCHKNTISISVDECTTIEDIKQLLVIFDISLDSDTLPSFSIPQKLQRNTPYLQQSVFKQYQSETKLLRYIKQLEKKDLSLADAMIPLGSCTMKLNATTELTPLSNALFSNIHPFSQPTFTAGYRTILSDLENFLSNITGFHKTSLQPNSGAQGEFAGLMCIRDYFEKRNESHRNIAFIPTSAHGTNPASASLCGLTIVPITCNSTGEISMDDLNKKIERYRDSLAVIMITYPSTFGVFDQNITDVCQLIHDAGGQVYMDGANMNAQVGLTSPSSIGADVCHLNLHKTFCIPHGGGGPGVGPICVAKHLSEFLPAKDFSKNDIQAISNTGYGSASICLISYAYIKLMGSNGLIQATQHAILNANYIAQQLSDHYEVMYKNKNNCVAHELIINCKSFKKEAGITVEDIAKRLMDFGFHAPTMSWPVPDSLMIEPTESESLKEINRFCNAMIQIKNEINNIIHQTVPVEESPLRNAPHTVEDIKSPWKFNYSTKTAFFPNNNDNSEKFWPSVNRIDHAHGDRNLICTCQPMEININLETNESIKQ